MHTPEEFGWSYIFRHKDEYALAAPTWENFQRLYSLYNSVFVQQLLPPTRNEWQYEGWVDLQEQIIAFAQQLLQCPLTMSQHKFLTGLVGWMGDEAVAGRKPVDISGVDLSYSDTLEDGDLTAGPDEADWWKK
jgi:hypothetical protein